MKSPSTFHSGVFLFILTVSMLLVTVLALGPGWMLGARHAAKSISLSTDEWRCTSEHTKVTGITPRDGSTLMWVQSTSPVCDQWTRAGGATQ